MECSHHVLHCAVWMRTILGACPDGRGLASSSGAAGSTGRQTLQGGWRQHMRIGLCFHDMPRVTNP